MFIIDETMKARLADICDVLSGADYPDGTYNLETLEPMTFKTGYQVTFCCIGDNYDNETFSYLVDMFTENSMDGRTYAGKFDGAPEISWRIADKKTAKRLAKQFNQICIWDWSKSKSIITGGTGRA